MLAAGIEQAFATTPQLVAGVGGVFDVMVNGELFYSKFRTRAFPDNDRLIAQKAKDYGK